MESNLTPSSKPFRVGIFPTIEQADRAVAGLLNAGFTKDHISVVCSDKIIEKHFGEFEHEEPSGTHTPAAVAAGGAIGALLGGLMSVAAATATGGVGLIMAGPLAAGAGAVVGGLIGAMTTRGVENGLADYYDQAVTRGKILVAADAHGDRAAERLTRAEAVLREAGAEPIPLMEG